MSLLNKNNVYIIGEMVEVKDFKTLTYGADAKEAVSATVVVKCMIGETENLIEARTFISRYTSKGTENKNYATIMNINNMLNKRIVISQGNLQSDRFWSSQSQQLVNSTKINFNLIRLARSTENEDKATFEFGGFVTRPLAEICDEDGNVKYYQITLGQANYKEDNMFEVSFIVDKNNAKAVKVIDANYEAGKTVEINGICQTLVSQHTVETEVAFGDPVIKTYTNVDKKYIITGGSEPVTGEGEHTDEVIGRLVAAYRQSGEDIQNAKKDASGTSTTAPGAKSKKSSLAGLI